MHPEIDIQKNLLIEPDDYFGHLVNLALQKVISVYFKENKYCYVPNLSLFQKNKTSWVYLTMASDYFRAKGDYANSVKCLQRALYYVPK